jgi:hypothetical protein
MKLRGDDWVIVLLPILPVLLVFLLCGIFLRR